MYKYDYEYDYEHGGGDDDDDGVLESQELTTIVAIALILILLTIAFERTKEYAEHHSPERMHSVVEKLFGELTILGFLSMFTFICTRAHFFGHLSEAIFGEGKEEELTEYFEFVHYAIFVLMLFFCGQVVGIIVSAEATTSTWLSMDEMIKEKLHFGVLSAGTKQKVKEQVSLDTSNRRVHRIGSRGSLLSESDEDETSELAQAIFEGLRKEFILERSTEPPFEPVSKEFQVEEDFNFGSYLSNCHTHLLEEIIDIHPPALLFMAFCVLLYYGYAMAINGNMAILAWTWVILGFSQYFFNVYFLNYLVQLRNQFLPRKTLKLLVEADDKAKSKNNNSNETNETHPEGDYLNHVDLSVGEEHQALLKIHGEPLMKNDDSNNCSNAHGTPCTHYDGCGEDDDEDLPTWCDVDLNTTRPGWIAQIMVGGKPDRQQVLFWMSQKGPVLFVCILQVQLLFTGIYLGLVFLHYLPFVMGQHHWLFSVVYLFLALGPFYAMRVNLQPLASILTQVTSMGNLRKPHVVSDVMLQDKTMRVVRMFIILYKIRAFAEKQSAAPCWAGGEDGIAPSDKVGVGLSNPSERRHPPKKTAIDKLELHHVGKTFDSIDVDGSGEIDRDELHELMGRLGADVTSAGLDRMFDLLDEDGNGTIERNEFIAWFEDHLEDDHKTPPKQRAHDIFETFDKNQAGEITVGDFKRKLDSLNFGFSVDEIGAIASELDRDRSGTVSLIEFEQMLVKYHPDGGNGCSHH